jgi:hypothetical protein
VSSLFFQGSVVPCSRVLTLVPLCPWMCMCVSLSPPPSLSLSLSPSLGVGGRADGHSNGMQGGMRHTAHKRTTPFLPLPHSYLPPSLFIHMLKRTIVLTPPTHTHIHLRTSPHHHLFCPQSDESGSHFLGVPFAAAPTGALRWASPHPLAPWNNTREATQYSASCMQDSNFFTKFAAYGPRFAIQILASTLDSVMQFKQQRSVLTAWVGLGFELGLELGLEMGYS